MKLDLTNILTYQKEFDTLVYTLNKVEFKDINKQLHLALMCELMELCNEIRCFNYWSSKKRNSDEMVLSEFADVLSFALSEAVELYDLDLKTTIQIHDVKINDDKQIQTQAFLNLINLYNQITDLETIKIFIQKLIELGYMLGYDFATQEQAHFKKCEQVKIIQIERSKK